MPSEKPVLKANTDQWVIDKMKYIAKTNERSVAKEVIYVCKAHIAAYEAEHGEIILPDPDQLEDKK